MIHSDDPILAQRLNQEAAAALAAGRKLGLKISDEEAIGWITSNPAKMLGITDKTGTLEAGKMADIVVWNANPLSVYAKADRVYVDGALLFDRANPGLQPRSDFMIDRKAGGNE